MKLYKLRFTQDDFVSKESNVWRTDVIDLYDNDQYKNYSARRAPYGSDLLGDGTYTGLNSPDGVNSEIGFVDSGRFLDTSGAIDILTWKVSLSQAAEARTDIKLNLYSTLESGLSPYYAHATPSLVNDWATSFDIDPGSTIYKFNSERYCFFELDFVSDAAIDPNAELELIVGVEIYPPAINGFFPGTRRALDRFPEWMEMREWNPLDINDEDKATPTKLGSLFINSSAGEWLTDLRGKVGYEEFQRHIETVDLDQKAWVYRTSDVPLDIFTAEYNNGGGDTQLTFASGLREFYECLNTADVFYHNRSTQEIYTLKEYTSLKINGEEYDQEPYLVWNALDDLGVAVDLFRIYEESNESFQKRILDVYINKPGVSVDRFKKALRRELNLWQYEGATPSSDYLGATPEVLTMEDIEASDLYFGADGVPKEAFYDLVDELAKKYPMSWGLFRYGEALWDSDGLYHKGVATIPKQFDAATPGLAQYQSGVGDINDLFVLRPDFYKPEQDFDVTLAVRGRRPTSLPQTTEIRFQAEVGAFSTYTTATYPKVTTPFYIRITSGGVDYIANIDQSAAYYGGDPGLINLDTYTTGGTWPPPNLPEAIVKYEWFTPGGLTASFLTWYRESDGLEIDTPFDISTITNIDIRPRSWDPDTQTESAITDANYFNLKFVDSSLTGKLGHGGTATLTNASPNFTTQDLVLQYQAYDFTVTVADTYGFVTPLQPIEVVINKDNVPGSGVVTVGNFNIPDYNDSGTAQHRVWVQLSEQDENGDYGVFTNNGQFIEANGNLTFNGDSTWVDGANVVTLGTPLTAGETVDFTFSCTTAPGYPETINTWEPIYETQVVPLVDNKINEHGPYRYGLPPRPENSDFTLATLDLERDDFGLSAGDIVTWIGVDDVSNDNVLVWTETNSIVPQGEPVGLYPDNAIYEYDNDTFSPLKVYSKLRPNINPEWNPFVHAGWFHEDQTDYYLFAEPESATLDSGSNIILSSQPQQGAPIIVEKDSGPQLRQIAMFNSATPLYFSESKFGTGTDSLFVGYNNITDVVVHNKSLNEAVSITSTSFATNEIKTTTDTDKTHEYTITYKPSDSFYADNLATPGQTELLFTDAADPDPYTITWEASEFNPTAQIELPLHTVYNSMTEGFIYIDHDEHELDYVEAQISPSHMLATPGDYALVTLKAYDKFGNPKPNVNFGLIAPSTVTLSASSVTTDAVGHAFFYLEAQEDSVSDSIGAYITSNTTIQNMQGIWDAKYGNDSTLPNLGTAGSALDATNSDLIRVDGPALWLPTTKTIYNNYIEIEPPTPSTNPTAEWIVRVMGSTPAVNNNGLLNQTEGVGTRAFYSDVEDTGEISFATSSDASSWNPAQVVSHGSEWLPNEWRWWKITWDGDELQAFYADDDGTSNEPNEWTASSVGPQAYNYTAMVPTTAPITLGWDTLGHSAAYSRFILRDAPGGNIRLDFDAANDIPDNVEATSFEITSGQTATVFRSNTDAVTTLIQANSAVYLDHESPYASPLTVSNNSVFDVAADEDFVAVFVGRVGHDPNPIAEANIFGSYSSNEGFVFTRNTNTPEWTNATVGNGSTAFSPLAILTSEHAKFIHIAVLDRATNDFTYYTYDSTGAFNYSSSINAPTLGAFASGADWEMISNSPSVMSTGMWNKGVGIAPSEEEVAKMADNIATNNFIGYTSMDYEMRPLANATNKVVAVMDSNQINADGESATTLFGYVYDPNDNPVVGVSVYWRKARDIKTLLADVGTSSSTATPGQNNNTGAVTTDANGRFTVGPFISHDEPGYWLVSVETLSPAAGDVTYWYEYLNGTNMLDPVSLQPYADVQESTPASYYENYFATPAYPVTFDERDYTSIPTGAGPEWAPPKWYPILRYIQYQMGLLGSGYYNYDTAATPDYDDFVES